MTLSLNYTNSELSAMSRMFSSGVLREMAQKKKSPLLVRLISESELLKNTASKQNSVKNLFETIYSILKLENNRSEYIYRAAITNKILCGKHRLKASMLSEFRIANCKADVVILNGTSTVYEIKSERDTLNRLLHQVSTYSSVFVNVNVITAEKYFDSVLKIVPNEVGIMCLTKQDTISTKRNATSTYDKIDPLAIFDCIQLHEARKVLSKMSITVPEVPNTELYKELRYIFGQFTTNKQKQLVHDAMLKVLKETRSLLSLSSYIGELPPSLHAAVLSSNLSKKERSNLLEALEVPIDNVIKYWN